MVITAFPPLDGADETGLLAVGGDLEVPSLLLAYRSGIFPWPFDERTLAWFSPPERGILFLDSVRFSRSFLKFLRTTRFTVAINRNTPAVIEACARSKNRGAQQGTWITRRMCKAYIELHRAGYCHSFECYDGGTLVGGLYGVSLGGMFAGESMFYLRPNASKVALYALCRFLSSRGYRWIDCQMVTPFFEQLGAQLMEREVYLRLLEEALTMKGAEWPGAGGLELTLE
jgi:leucyl/phenylalanyl-tRNA---protein transferase